MAAATFSGMKMGSMHFLLGKTFIFVFHHGTQLNK